MLVFRKKPTKVCETWENEHHDFCFISFFFETTQYFRNHNSSRLRALIRPLLFRRRSWIWRKKYPKAIVTWKIQMKKTKRNETEKLFEKNETEKKQSWEEFSRINQSNHYSAESLMPIVGWEIVENNATRSCIFPFLSSTLNFVRLSETDRIKCTLYIFIRPTSPAIVL